MKLKICGVRSVEMAQKCQDLNVDFIGLNFVKTSKRFIDLERCNDIAKTFLGIKVGVFMDQDIDFIVRAKNLASLQIIQLHGGESSEFIESVREGFKPSPTKIKIWKAFKIDENFDPEILKSYTEYVDLFLFDGKNPGSGKNANLDILQKVIQFCDQDKITYGIAGGINTENICQFKENFPNAFLLDTASGVEKNGEFYSEILEKLVQNFRNVA